MKRIAEYIHTFTHGIFFWSIYIAAVLNRWVATSAAVAWRFAGCRLGPSEICKQSCRRMNLSSDAVNIYFISMSVTEFQVFCSDIMFLFPRHRLCVKQDFKFAGSSKSPLLSLLGLIFPYTIKQLPLSNTASFSFDNYS